MIEVLIVLTALNCRCLVALFFEYTVRTPIIILTCGHTDCFNHKRSGDIGQEASARHDNCRKDWTEPHERVRIPVYRGKEKLKSCLSDTEYLRKRSCGEQEINHGRAGSQRSHRLQLCQCIFFCSIYRVELRIGLRCHWFEALVLRFWTLGHEISRLCSKHVVSFSNPAEIHLIGSLRHSS